MKNLKYKPILRKRATTLISQAFRQHRVYSDSFYLIEKQLYCNKTSNVINSMPWLIKPKNEKRQEVSLAKYKEDTYSY